MVTNQTLDESSKVIPIEGDENEADCAAPTHPLTPEMIF
jgi:hypothetical protein